MLRAGRWRVATAICYEIVYPDLVRRDAHDADAIVTISNDTWFGRSIGPLQHLQMAQMRALENGRYVLRATNNGVTAIIASDGEIVARAPQFEPTVLTGTFAGMVGTTPYSNVGDGPLVGILASVLAFAAFVRVRKRASR